jgi:putative ABC transport system permease protein
MWKDYSSGYIKNNRSSSLSVRLSAFISALLLSLLCGLFYNVWKYEVERIELEEGGWQSRIIGEIAPEDAEAIKNYANVKEVTVNENEIDIYFDDYRRVLSDTPHIASLLGVPPEKVVYNYELLAMYLVRDPRDTAPRLLFPMFIVIMALASFSLIAVIYNSFAVSMNSRIHQFGILSGIGAAPRQIRACLLQEAAALCILPVIAGNVLGIAGCAGLMQIINILGSGAAGRHNAVFGYHPLVLAATLLATTITIWISAWLPARKLSRLTPLDAIRNTGELQLNHKKNSYLSALLFGVEGELAGNALKVQRKALRTASLSFILSFMAFSIMQCFFSLSVISTRETYFEKYQNVWDIMVTLKDIDVDAFEDIDGVQELDGVENAAAYQKAAAKTMITEEEISEEMKSFGGFSQASEEFVTKTDEGWMVNAPIIILDDQSFLNYCEQIGVEPQLDGAVVRNKIRDVTNPDFRHPVYMPYIEWRGDGENASSVLRQSGNEKTAVEIPVLAYTEKVPVLREEYAALDYYELVHFIPASLWKEIKDQIGGTEETCYIRILSRENAALEELNMLQEEIERLIGGKYTLEGENRIQEYETNKKQIQGVKVIFGGFCVLLAIIGIGNVFSNTLGFVRQRKREFARYMSIGMTPKEIRKMFCIEAVTIAVRPILTALLPSVIAVRYMLKKSYLEVEEFMAEAPLIPVAIFMLAIIGSVGLAYYSAWRNMRRINLPEVLRDDTLW